MPDDANNNVVCFPGARVHIETADPNAPRLAEGMPKTVEEADQKYREVYIYYINKAMAQLYTLITNHLEKAGIAYEGPIDEAYARDYIVIAEALRAHMYACCGLKHPFQVIGDLIMCIDENRDVERHRKIAERLNLEYSE